MAEFDPIEGLVALGVVSREQAEAAARVPLWVSASRVGRLVYAGVEPQELMSALSSLTGIPVASREMIQRAERFLLQPQLVRTLRDLLACPVRRDTNGTVHILVADPGARDEIARYLLNFRAYLAVETEVRGLLEHLWPLGSSMEGAAVLEGDTEPGSPLMSDSQPSAPPRAATPPPSPAPPRAATPLPASATRRAAPPAAAPPRSSMPPAAPPRAATPPPAPPPAPPRAATPPPAPPPAPLRTVTPPPSLPRSVAPPSGLPTTGTTDLASMPDPFSSFHINVPSTSPGTLGRGESVLREVGRTVERPFEAPSQPPSRPVHEPFQLNAPRGPPRTKTRPSSGSDDTVDNTVDNTLENTIDDNSDQTMRLPAAPASAAGPTPSSLPVPPQGRREAEGVSMAPEGPSTQRSFLAGSVLGVVATLVIALLLIGGVLMMRGGDDDSGDELRARQEELLADAKNSAEKSDHAWAVAKADEVLKLDRTTRAAAAALVLRGKARLALSDRDGVDDLREALRLLPVGDGLRWEAERALTGAGLDQ